MALVERKEYAATVVVAVTDAARSLEIKDEESLAILCVAGRRLFFLSPAERA